MFTFHYQLVHLLIKTLSQFTFKTTHVKNVCDAYLKLILKTQHVSVSPPTIIRGQFPYLTQLLRKVRELTPDDGWRTDRNMLGFLN